MSHSLFYLSCAALPLIAVAAAIIGATLAALVFAIIRCGGASS
jgi:hypothetical protein